MNDFLEITSFVIPLVIAITFHEAAHGFVACAMKDPTAKRAGRVTLNPLRHVDRFGTIILPGLLLLVHSPILFGYAKPVPVNFRNLKPARLGMFLVAFAGPGMNLLLAYISALLTHLDAVIAPERAEWFFMNLYNSITVNVVLAAFNLLPLLPLDGGRVLNSLLPAGLARAHAKTERFGIVLVLLLLMLPRLLPQAPNLMQTLVWVPADHLRDFILHAAGIGNG